MIVKLRVLFGNLASLQALVTKLQYLVNLGLAGGQGALLGHDGLLQGLQRVLQLLDLDDGLRLLLLELPLGVLHLASPLAEGGVRDLAAGLEVAGHLGQDPVHHRPDNRGSLFKFKC